MLHQLEQLRVLGEEVLPRVAAGRHGVLLVVAVHRLFHPPDQQTAFVGSQQRIPVAAPDDLDHPPAGTSEGALQLLDDLAVAAHRAVEALQVAVDDEDQVVELLAPRQAEGPKGLRLVGFAVA